MDGGTFVCWYWFLSLEIHKLLVFSYFDNKGVEREPKLHKFVFVVTVFLDQFLSIGVIYCMLDGLPVLARIPKRNINQEFKKCVTL